MELVPFGIHNITKHNGGRTKGQKDKRTKGQKDKRTKGHWADAPRH
ncbi:HNH endonuclease [Bacillus mycoides]